MVCGGVHALLIDGNLFGMGLKVAAAFTYLESFIDPAEKLCHTNYKLVVDTARSVVYNRGAAVCSLFSRLVGACFMLENKIGDRQSFSSYMRE